MSKMLVVTRHPALVQYLIEIGLVNSDVKVLTHAMGEDVLDRIVIGELPYQLAALAEAVVEVPLNLPSELQGKELTLEQVWAYAGSPTCYRVSTNFDLMTLLSGASSRREEARALGLPSNAEPSEILDARVQAYAAQHGLKILEGSLFAIPSIPRSVNPKVCERLTSLPPMEGEQSAWVEIRGGIVARVIQAHAHGYGAHYVLVPS